MIGKSQFDEETQGFCNIADFVLGDMFGVSGLPIPLSDAFWERRSQGNAAIKCLEKEHPDLAYSKKCMFLVTAFCYLFWLLVMKLLESDTEDSTDTKKISQSNSQDTQKEDSSTQNPLEMASKATRRQILFRRRRRSSKRKKFNKRKEL